MSLALAAWLMPLGAGPVPAQEMGAVLGGASFDVPVSMKPASASVGALAWESEDHAVRVTAFARDVEPGSAEDDLKAFSAWPAFALGLGKGLGGSIVKQLHQSPGAKCTFRFTPVVRDTKRWLQRVQVEAACSVGGPARMRVGAVYARTRVAVVTILVIDRGARPEVADGVASDIWRSLRVRPAEQLAPGPAAADPAAEPFSGCRVVSQTSDSWSADCFNSRLSVTDLPGGQGDASLVTAMTEGYAMSATPPVERLEVTFSLADGPVRGVRMLAGSSEDKSVQLMVAQLDRAEGRRLLDCNAYRSGEVLCEELIRGASQLGWRAGPPRGVPRADIKPTIAGRAYQAPAGCEILTQAPGFGMAQCESNALMMWGESGEQGPRLRESVDEWVRKLGVAGTAARCSLEGVQASCRHYVGPEGQGELYIAEAPVRGRALLVACANGGKASGQVPPVCASVLSVGPDARPAPAP